MGAPFAGGGLLLTYAQPLGGLPRLLMVIPWLIQEREVPVGEMEKRFAVTPEQLVEDIEALNDVDVFVSPEQRFSVEITGANVRVLEAPNFPSTPSLLPFEALACLVAAKTVLAMDPQVPYLDSAAEKLEKAVFPDGAEGLNILPAADPPWVRRFQEWARERSVVGMRYRSTDKGEVSDRVVEPWRVYQWSGSWYLWGYSRTKGEPRRYRIDGIQGAAPTGESFTLPRRMPPPPTTYQRASGDHRVVFSITPAGRWITDHYSMKIISEDSGGAVRAEFYTRDPMIAARLSLRLGADLRIVECDSARNALAQLAAAVLARYGLQRGMVSQDPA